MSGDTARETFASRFGRLATMIGVAVGLGNVWRFPYMVGRFGGASFVLLYIAAVALLGLPALMAEWALGRHTRRGPVGAFERAGLPLGRPVGWFFFAIVIAATGYYTTAIGWVLYFAVGQLAAALGLPWSAGAVLPPADGFSARAFGLQVLCTGAVILGCVAVLRRGLRSGIERASRFLVPALLGVLLLLIVRSLTLPGAAEGVRWYILKFDVRGLRPAVLLAALGQAFFSLSLGGTFMVVYGSYLGPRDDLPGNALGTALGDLTAGLLAGLAIMPAVFALGLEPGSGPGLLFVTLPEVFARIPGGAWFGLLFFLGLLGAAYLSDVAAFEVLVAGLTDNTSLDRRRAVRVLALVVFAAALPPMVNLRIFVPWDLTFGSGMQTLGSLLAVLAVGWCLDAAAMRRQLGGGRRAVWLLVWLRWGVPAAILLVGIWWFLTEVLGVATL